jgi:hypothetical protein
MHSSGALLGWKIQFPMRFRISGGSPMGFPAPLNNIAEGGSEFPGAVKKWFSGSFWIFSYLLLGGERGFF